jgi:hypothetical protein
MLGLVTLAPSVRKILVLEVMALLAPMVLIVQHDVPPWRVMWALSASLTWRSIRCASGCVARRSCARVEARRLDRLVRAVAIRQAQVYEKGCAPER